MEPLQEDIKRFVLNHIPSIPYLEALLLMRSDPKHLWGAEELARRLYIKTKAVDVIITQLINAGIIVLATQTPIGYQYSPQSDELKNIIDRLAEAYVTNLIEVTNLVHSNINKKAKKFASAFVLRKD